MVLVWVGIAVMDVEVAVWLAERPVVLVSTAFSALSIGVGLGTAKKVTGCEYGSAVGDGKTVAMELNNLLLFLSVSTFVKSHAVVRPFLEMITSLERNLSLSARGRMMSQKQVIATIR